jgi:hypothetical protein
MEPATEDTDDYSWIVSTATFTRVNTQLGGNSRAANTHLLNFLQVSTMINQD